MIAHSLAMGFAMLFNYFFRFVFICGLTLSVLWTTKQNHNPDLPAELQLAALPHVKPSKTAEFVEVMTVNEILRDKDNRVSKDFKIPRGLRYRTSFWFDIYTRYSSKTKVLHHKKYPWVVFDVIDTSHLRGKSSRSIRNYVWRQKQKTVKALKSISQRRHFKNMNAEEKRVFAVLKKLPGKKRHAARDALKQLRTQTGQRDYFMSGITRGSRYMGAMENIFKQEGLPLELTRLPLVESSFNKKAISKVGASGVWQIMPSIGRKLMMVNSTVDERNAPLKATWAAAELFKTNKRILKNWQRAVIAYNTGPFELRKAARKLKTDSPVRLIGNYKSGHFQFASRNFLPCFLAALHAEKYQKEIFGQVAKLEPVRFDIYHFDRKKRIRIQDVAKLSETTSKELLALNFDLRKAIKKNLKLPNDYMLYLPEGRGMILDRNLKKLEKGKDFSLKGAASKSVAQHLPPQSQL